MPKSKQKIKICNRCGSENRPTASECKDCQSERFAPEWVIAKRPINRQVSVEISRPNPKFGKSADRITLSKWWPGGRSSYHIPNSTQWDQISEIITTDLGPKLGWKTLAEAVEEVVTAGPGESGKNQVTEAFVGRPDIIRKIVESIDAESLSKKDFETLSDTLSEISTTISSASAGFREAFVSVVRKLPSQKQRALEDLSLLLQGWSLQAVTNVAQQVRSRIDTIELFENRIQDPRTYEIRGANSIHRILERSMWLIDERYWILHSNEPLRNFIGEKMAKKNKEKYGKLRPDFVCGMVGNRLIILELKRPKHKLDVDDLNQLEDYVIQAESHSDFTGYEAYLVGNEKSDALQKTMKHRSNSFKTLTYSDILVKTKEKYTAFLKSLDA